MSAAALTMPASALLCLPSLSQQVWYAAATAAQSLADG
jgi:hypothetical protein